jgi:hypothetical protein
MTRAGRCFPNFAVSVSLLLWFAAAVAWVQSYRSGWTVSMRRSRDEFHLYIYSRQGEISIGEGHSSWRWDIAYWKLCILLLVAPVRWVQRIMPVAARFRAGHCAVCGYDLRATPTRCPECGTVPGGKVLPRDQWREIVPRWIFLLVLSHAIASYTMYGFLIVRAVATRDLRLSELPLSELPEVCVGYLCIPVWPLRDDIFPMNREGLQFYACVAAISLLLLRTPVIRKLEGRARDQNRRPRQHRETFNK